VVGPTAVRVLCPNLALRRNFDIAVWFGSYHSFYLGMVAGPRRLVDGARSGRGPVSVFIAKDTADRIADGLAGIAGANCASLTAAVWI